MGGVLFAGSNSRSFSGGDDVTSHLFTREVKETCLLLWVLFWRFVLHAVDLLVLSSF